MRNIELQCDFLDDDSKMYIAILLTECHYNRRMHGFPTKAEGCNMECVQERGCLSQCLQRLSDFAFQIYTQFYNHIDSVCFYLQSHLWQTQTERSVNSLVDAATYVSGQLEDINATHVAMLEEQKEQQKQILRQSRRIKQVMGESTKLLHARITVLSDNFMITYGELSETVNRALILIELIKDMIHYVYSVVGYTHRVLTYFILCLFCLWVTTKRRRAARGPLLALVTVQCVGEALLQTSLRIVFTYYPCYSLILITTYYVYITRFLSLCVSIYIIIKSHISFKEPLEMCLERLESVIKRINNNCVKQHNDELASAFHINLLGLQSSFNKDDLTDLTYQFSQSGEDQLQLDTPAHVKRRNPGRKCRPTFTEAQSLQMNWHTVESPDTFASPFLHRNDIVSSSDISSLADS